MAAPPGGLRDGRKRSVSNQVPGKELRLGEVGLVRIAGLVPAVASDNRLHAQHLCGEAEPAEPREEGHRCLSHESARPKLAALDGRQLSRVERLHSAAQCTRLPGAVGMWHIS